jgi:hypothetical protein
MRKFFLCAFPVFLFVLITRQAFGEFTPSKMGSSTQPSSQIQGGMKPLDTSVQKSTLTTPSQTSLPALVKPPPQVPQHAKYLHPGILVYLNGEWQGSDHLLNLLSNIGVYVTILKPQDETLNITQEQLQNEVVKIFEKANIKPLTLAAEGKPPLPAFEIEIFLYPIEKGYAACCAGRLFESVFLDRFKMDSNMAFQAITWEKQSLIVGPKSTFAEQLTKNIQEIAAAFTERFQAYEKITREALR